MSLFRSPRAVQAQESVLKRVDQVALGSPSHTSNLESNQADAGMLRLLVSLRSLAVEAEPRREFSDHLASRLRGEAVRLHAERARRARSGARSHAGRLVACAALALALLVGVGGLISPVEQSFAEVLVRVTQVVNRLPGAPKGPAQPSAQIAAVPVALEDLAGRAGFAVWRPGYLPAGAQLQGAFLEQSASEGPIARLDYRVPLEGGRSYQVVEIRQSQPPQSLQLYVDPERVVRRATVAGHDAVIYTPGGPPTGREPLILTWTDGTSRREIWSTLPADALLQIARGLRP